RRERFPMAIGKGVVVPASAQNEDSPRVWQSRGSIARPEHWLSTLRPRPYGAEDARLASGHGPGLPGGIGYPQGCYERFPRCIPTSLPPFLGFSGRNASLPLSLGGGPLPAPGGGGAPTPLAGASRRLPAATRIPDGRRG